MAPIKDFWPADFAPGFSECEMAPLDANMMSKIMSRVRVFDDLAPQRVSLASKARGFEKSAL